MLHHAVVHRLNSLVILVEFPLAVVVPESLLAVYCVIYLHVAAAHQNAAVEHVV